MYIIWINIILSEEQFDYSIVSLETLANNSLFADLISQPLDEYYQVSRHKRHVADVAFVTSHKSNRSMSNLQMNSVLTSFIHDVYQSSLLYSFSEQFENVYVPFININVFLGSSGGGSDGV